MTSPLFPSITILGTGMIGGSLAHALKLHGVTTHIAGYDVSDGALRTSLELGIIDAAHDNPAAAVAEADLVVLCAPLSTTPALMAQVAGTLRPGVIVTDVGSAKQRMMREIRKVLPTHADFVPGHPIAGKEQSGPHAGTGDLFQGKSIFLTPEDTTADSVTRIRALWEAIGGHVECIDAAVHDRIFALTSHLPHLMAFAAATLGGDNGNLPTHYPVFLRIAASNPKMWADVFIYNATYVLQAIDAAILQLQTPDILASHAFRQQVRLSHRSPWDCTSGSPLLQAIALAAAHACVAIAIADEKIKSHALIDYLGAGFMDFTFPATASVDDTALLLNAHPDVVMRFTQALLTLRALIHNGDASSLEAALANARECVFVTR